METGFNFSVFCFVLREFSKSRKLSDNKVPVMTAILRQTIRTCALQRRTSPFSTCLTRPFLWTTDNSVASVTVEETGISKDICSQSTTASGFDTMRRCTKDGALHHWIEINDISPISYVSPLFLSLTDRVYTFLINSNSVLISLSIRIVFWCLIKKLLAVVIWQYNNSSRRSGL